MSQSQVLQYVNVVVIYIGNIGYFLALQIVNVNLMLLEFANVFVYNFVKDNICY